MRDNSMDPMADKTSGDDIPVSGAGEGPASEQVRARNSR